MIKQASRPRPRTKDTGASSAPQVLKKRKKKRNSVDTTQEYLKKPHMKKFWAQRYKLFSKFDEGILLDEGNGIAIFV